MRSCAALLVLLAVGCAPAEVPDASTDVDATVVRADGGPDDAPVLDTFPSLDAAAGLDAGSGPASRCSGAHTAPDLRGVTLARIDAVPVRDGFAPGWGIVEGPVWIGDALLVSHFGGGPTPSARLYRVRADGSVSIAREDAGTNGLAMGSDGRLYGASHALGAIVAFDLGDLSRAPETIVGSFEGARFDGPNDLALRSDGTIYFTDPDYQAPSPRPQPATRVYRRAPDGTVESIADDLTQPNGIALSLDERTLFVGHARGLVRYPLDARGAISGPRTTIDSIRGGVDGLGRDCAGDLYVTNEGAIVVLRPDGSELGRLEAPGATNVAFGGPDGRTLYVTSLGDPPMLRQATLDVVGLPD
ncbi:MAG: SMP-30/gluconolactonase/LRE family protein [Sandaracinaceae bacterium]